LHACTKQTANGTGEFAFCDGPFSGNGDIAMHGEPPVKLASSKLQVVGFRLQVVGLADVLFSDGRPKVSCNCHWRVRALE